MYQVTLACKGVPITLGPAGAVDCEWSGEELLLCEQNDWDGDAKALLDEFSDSYQPASREHLTMRLRSDRSSLFPELRLQRRLCFERG
jgi:hypothetical protein